MKVSAARQWPISVTAASEAERAVAVSVLSFSADPISRWSLPDPHAYLTHFPAIVRGMGGRAFSHGTGYHVGDFAGAALWLPPGVHTDEEGLGAVLEQGVPHYCEEWSLEESLRDEWELRQFTTLCTR